MFEGLSVAELRDALEIVRHPDYSVLIKLYSNRKSNLVEQLCDRNDDETRGVIREYNKFILNVDGFIADELKRRRSIDRHE